MDGRVYVLVCISREKERQTKTEGERERTNNTYLSAYVENFYSIGWLLRVYLAFNAIGSWPVPMFACVHVMHIVCMLQFVRMLLWQCNAIQYKWDVIRNIAFNSCNKANEKLKNGGQILPTIRTIITIINVIICVGHYFPNKPNLWQYRCVCVCCVHSFKNMKNPVKLKTALIPDVDCIRLARKKKIIIENIGNANGTNWAGSKILHIVYFG